MRRPDTEVARHTRATQKGKRWGGRRYTMLLVLALMVFAGMGIAYAANIHIGSLQNNLQSRNTSIVIDEDFPDDNLRPGETADKEVKFTNTGSSAVFLRVSYAETWTKSAGDVWIPDDGNHAIKNWTSDWLDPNVWEHHTDGWYYYKLVLSPGTSTAVVLDSVTFLDVNDVLYDPIYTSAAYELGFIAEVVQLSDEDDVNSNLAGTGATQTVFGRNATVVNPTLAHGAVTGGTVIWS